MNSKPPARIFLPLLCAAVLLVISVQANSCLWKATSTNGTVYIQGSVHLLKSSDYPLDPAIEKAYAKSNVLIFETNLKDMTAPKTQQMIMEKAQLPTGRTLKEELDPDVYSQLSEELVKAGIPIAGVQQFKPWFVSILLMVSRMQVMDLDPNLGLDQYFFRKATDDGKNIVGLETIEFQFSLFDSLSDANQNAYTRYFLKDLEQMETMLPEIMTAWKNGDIKTIDNIFREGFKEYPGMYEKFLTDRNKLWVEEIAKMTRPDSIHMVVVGSAHLAGAQGLIELLKTRGYAVEQL